MEDNTRAMVQHLNEAMDSVTDAPDAPPAPVSYKGLSTGGRPRIEMNRAVLQEGLELRGGPSHLTRMFSASARTIRRRAVDYGIAPPGDPVYVTEHHPDGSRSRRYHTGRNPSTMLSSLTNEQLDRIIQEALEQYPTFGLRMLHGHLMSMGNRVPRQRLSESYVRVHGNPATFGERAIHRQPYHVAGANSLWHHDGQHGEMALGNTWLHLLFHLQV